MWNHPELKDFVRAPIIFVQSGFPLKISLYLYHPFERRVSLFKKRGEILDLAAMLELKTRGPQLLTPKEDYHAAMSYLMRAAQEPISD